MSVQDQLAPYLNRFVFLLNYNENVKLYITYKDGKLMVSFNHDMSIAKEVHEHLKKNTPSQFNRLKKRAQERAEEARHQAREQ